MVVSNRNRRTKRLNRKIGGMERGWLGDDPSVSDMSVTTSGSRTEKKTSRLWSPEEISKLMELYSVHGENWSKIAEYFPGRTDSAVMHRIYREKGPVRTNRLKSEMSKLVAEAAAHDFKSEYTGVFWNKKQSFWSAQIKHNGKKTDLGNFTNDKDAAIAYDDAARRLRPEGKVGYLNFPRENEKSKRPRTSETKEDFSYSPPIKDSEKELLLGIALDDIDEEDVIDDADIGDLPPPETASSKKNKKTKKGKKGKRGKRGKKTK